MTTCIVPTATELAQRYRAVRAFTERLADPLSPEDQTIQSMADVSPTKWHRAHTTWFFETFVLGPHVPDHTPFQAEFGFLFNSYYETVGARHTRARRGMISRPSAADISYYRSYVDDAMATLLTRHDVADDEDLRRLVELGLHHEEQHQELLLMDIKHVLAQNPMAPSYRSARSAPSVASEMGWRRFAATTTTVGADGRAFAFDNEGPRHRVVVDGFEIADRLVTCGEWMAFIDDGGYEHPTLWLSDGWYQAQDEGWRAPLYWDLTDDGPMVFTLHGRRPVDADEPVTHVSHYEADAFARWAGARLPTEFEWEVAHAEVPVAPRPMDPDGVLHPQTRPASGAVPSGVYGETWQWTASAYLGFPGFQPAPGAVGEYNGKFMSNQMVLRGSACVTPTGHERLTYRNFYPPHSRWMFSGVRLARDAS